MPRALRMLTFSAALSIGVVSSVPAGADDFRFIEQPVIVPNPNPAVPLAAVLKVAVSQPGNGYLEVSAGDASWRKDLPRIQAGANSLPVVGLKPGGRHHFKLVVAADNGARIESSTALEFVAPPLPTELTDFPRLTLNKIAKEGMEPGITLMTVRRRAIGRPHLHTPAQRDFGTKWGLILGVDAAGEIVWYYRSSSRIAGITQLRNGNIFYHTEAFSPVEIDILGNKVRQWGAALGPRKLEPGSIPVAVTTLHHQPEELPNGNFLSMMAYPKVIENYYTSEYDANAPRKTQKVMGDEIIEFTPDGNVVWRWNTFDHLDPFRIGYDTVWSYWWVRGFPDHLDWTHGNGVHYDKRDDSVIFSLRNQDAIFKVDRKTKEIKWILAKDDGWSPALRKKLLKPVGDNFRWPSHQHNPRVTEAGTVIVFNNNVYQARPFTGHAIVPPERSYSSAIEYDIDEQAGTARVAFVTPALDAGTECNSFAMGDAHRLPKTGNVLVAYSLCFPGLKIETMNTMDRSKQHPNDLPVTPRIIEYSRTAPYAVVLDIEVKPPSDLFQWEVYGLLRIPLP